MIRYQIHLSEGRITEIEAAKILIGLKKVWLYDAEDNLIGTFVWDRIDGFQVIGSAAGQVIVDGDLPHERKQKDPEKLARREKKGVFLTELETAHHILVHCGNQLRDSWIVTNNFQSKHKTELQLVVDRQRGELQQLEAALLDGYNALTKVFQLTLEEIRTALKQGAK